ncbi:MAG: tetratricopeptide repeat protein [Pseudomonadota bacterium]
MVDAVTALNPDSTVVFLFSDIAGSTRLWEQHTAAMAEALARHDALARSAVLAWRGHLVKATGDGIHAAFAEAADALGAMLQLQRGLAAAAAAGSLPLAVRCGLHAGPGQARDNDYFGPEVNRAARIMAAAHGGQMLVSQAVADLLLPALPAGVALRELGAVRLKDLDRPERLWQVLAPPLRQDFPALRSLEATPNNLAQQLNRFIGRETVLPALRGLLTQHRLVTLLGTGGIGKSRLALQLAAELVEQYPDGVWFVELAPLDDGQRLPQALASVLGVKEEPGRPLDEALRHHVAGRRLLLVLDNCEHVLDAAAALAKALLQASAGLTVLATSREPLRLAGELAYPVPPLGLPDAAARADTPTQLLQHEAVRLFVDRARSAQPTFELNPGNAQAVLEICQRLDGIALALELAAARVRALPVQAMAERLRDSFALLSTRDATVAPRQRTLQTLIDWSHDLLAPPERVLYRRLSVFAGGWTLEAAEAVCADGVGDDAQLPAPAVMDLLAALADKSLVSALPGDDGTQRYRLLDTVRQHAAALLAAAGDEAAPLRRRHAAAQLALAEAEAAQQQLGGAHKAAALARLDQERDNLLAALGWCAQDQAAPGARAAAELGLRLSFALRPYWLNRGLLSLWLDTTLRLLAHPAAQLRDGLRARALFNAGQVASFMGRYAQAVPHLSECLDIAHAIGDAPRAAAALQPLGMAAIGLGDLEAARRHLEAAVAAGRTLNNPPQLASALNALAQLDRMQGRLAAAEARYTEALGLAQDLGDQEYIAGLQLNLAMVSLASGEVGAACNRLLIVLGIVDQIGSRLAAISALDVCTGLAMAVGDVALTARWHAAAESAYAVAGMRRDAADAAFLEDFLQAARATTGATFNAEVDRHRGAVFETVWSELPAWLAALTRSRGTGPAASAACRPR